jgi:hypothetical protein
MLATKILAAMALALQATAAPGPRGSGLQLKRDNCDADFALLVVEGSCQPGQNTCEFCCPDGYNVPVESGLDHCHQGHIPYECAAGYTEWHCDSHA